MRRPQKPHAQLETELNSLLDSVSYHEAPEEVKQQVRLIKNRLSAKRSRDSARSYVRELEIKVAQMNEQADFYYRRLQQLEAENLSLKTSQYVSKDTMSFSFANTTLSDPLTWQQASTKTDQSPVSAFNGMNTVKRTEVCEPAALKPQSLQLDALLLFMSIASFAPTEPTASPQASVPGVLPACPSPLSSSTTFIAPPLPPPAPTPAQTAAAALLRGWIARRRRAGPRMSRRALLGLLRRTISPI